MGRHGEALPPSRTTVYWLPVQTHAGAHLAGRLDGALEDVDGAARIDLVNDREVGLADCRDRGRRANRELAVFGAPRTVGPKMVVFPMA